jgi:hypothetical protein
MINRKQKQPFYTFIRNIVHPHATPGDDNAAKQAQEIPLRANIGRKVCYYNNVNRIMYVEGVCLCNARAPLK